MRVSYCWSRGWVLRYQICAATFKLFHHSLDTRTANFPNSGSPDRMMIILDICHFPVKMYNLSRDVWFLYTIPKLSILQDFSSRPSFCFTKRVGVEGSTAQGNSNQLCPTPPRRICQFSRSVAGQDFFLFFCGAGQPFSAGRGAHPWSRPPPPNLRFSTFRQLLTFDPSPKIKFLTRMMMEISKIRIINSPLR